MIFSRLQGRNFNCQFRNFGVSQVTDFATYSIDRKRTAFYNLFILQGRAIKAKVCTFASGMQRMRLFSARLLLGIFFPMLLLQVVHHHEGAACEEVVCTLCANHTHHAGHLAAQTAGTCECLLCQLFGTPFVAPVVMALMAVVLTSRAWQAPWTAMCCGKAVILCHPRGPPVLK